MLPRNEKGSTTGQAEQERTSAEMAVINPNLAGLHCLQQRLQQRALLAVAVRTGQNIFDDHGFRIEHGQHYSGQRSGVRLSQHGQAMFRPSQMVAVQNLDAVTRQQRGAQAFHVPKQGTNFAPCMLHHSAGDRRFQAVQLLVERLHADADLFFLSGISRIHRLARAADHQTHEINDVREKQFTRILFLRHSCKQLVELLRSKYLFHRRAHHQTGRCLFDKPFQNCAKHHGSHPPWLKNVIRRGWQHSQYGAEGVVFLHL